MSLGVSAVNPPDTTISNRPPTESDYVIFGLNHLWFVKYDTGVIPYEVYYLASKEGLRASWIKLYPQGGGGGSLTTVTDDAETEEPDVNNRLYLLGGNDPGYPAVYSNIETRKENDNSVVTFLTTSIYQPPTSADGSAGVYSLGSSDNLVNDRFLHGYGEKNTFLGEEAGNLTLTVGSSVNNTCIGYTAGIVLDKGKENTFLGAYTGAQIVDGERLVLLGASNGLSYTTVESDNILIGTYIYGTALESNVLRIGDVTGVGEGALADAYIQGIYGSTEGAAAKVVVCGSEGKLSTAILPVSGAANFVTDDGTAVVTVDEIQVLGADNINTSSLPDGTTNVVTVHLNKSIIQPHASVDKLEGVYSLGTWTGTETFMHNYGWINPGVDGAGNTFLGPSAGNINVANIGSNQIGIGNSALSSAISLSDCVAIGTNALLNSTDAQKCVAIGSSSMEVAVSSTDCVCLGHNAGQNLTTGSHNLLIGSGVNATTTGSSNILLNTTVGLPGAWSNKLFIGNATGTGDGELDSAYICGIYQKLPPQHKNLVLIDSDNQLGSIEMGAEGEVLTAHGPGSEPTWETSASGAYSTGTFVPNFQTVLGSVYTDFTGMVFSQKTGTWIKIGKLVYYEINMVITNVGTGLVGHQVVISNMPFVSQNIHFGKLSGQNFFITCNVSDIVTYMNAMSDKLLFKSNSAMDITTYNKIKWNNANITATELFSEPLPHTLTYPMTFNLSGSYITT